MRRALGALLGLGPTLMLPFAMACAPRASRPQGSALGTFDVHGDLEENGCRPGFEPLDPLELSVELRRDATTIVWRAEGGAPVGGTLRDDGSFRIVSRRQVLAWPADSANGVVGCTLEQIETVSGTLVMQSSGADGGPGGDASMGSADGGVATAVSFSAEHEIEIVPVLGADCAALLISNGGSFPSLPCSATYHLEAARSSD